MQRKPLRPTVLVLLLITLASSHAFALHNRTRDRKSNRSGRIRRIPWNPLLRGSHQSLLRQNEEIDRLQLPRIANDQELEALKAREELVPIEDSQYLRVAPNLDPTRRFCRPWTRDFLEDLGQAYYEEFRQPIQVNSAVRTVEQQRKLRRRNRNAAPEKGEIASSHLAGITVDINKRGLTRKQRHWIEQYMVELKQLGLIEPAEERRQPVFHVMVSDRYTSWREANRLAAK